MFAQFRSARHSLMRRAENLRRQQKRFRHNFSGFAKWTWFESGRILLLVIACVVSFPVYLLQPANAGFALLAWRNGSGKFSESYRQYTLLRRTTLVFGFVFAFSLILWLSSIFI
ncbi:MAG: hypothetical protein WC497_04225 [Patescibacteria group bacterium]